MGTLRSQRRYTFAVDIVRFAIWTADSCRPLLEEPEGAAEAVSVPEEEEVEKYKARERFLYSLARPKNYSKIAKCCWFEVLGSKREDIDIYSIF